MPLSPIENGQSAALVRAVLNNALGFAASRVYQNDLNGGSSLGVGNSYYDVLSANRTVSFSGTVEEGSFVSLKLIVSQKSELTIPESFRVGETGGRTKLTLPIGRHELSWIRANGVWWLMDTVGLQHNLQAQVDPNTTNGQSEGYDLLSLWRNVNTEEVFICHSIDETAAFWSSINRPRLRSGMSIGNATLSLSIVHLHRYMRTSHATGVTLTVPDAATAGWPNDAVLMGVQSGAGQVTIVAGGSTTINVPAGKVAKTRAQFSPWQLIRVSNTNAWDLSGDLEDAP